MNNNSDKKQIILYILAALVVGLLAGLYIADLRALPTEPVTTETDSQVDVIFDYGDGEIDSFPNLAVEEGASVFTALKQLEEQGDITLSHEDYGGDLGALITGINGRSGEGDAWWQYWVNGEYVSVGVSNYSLRPGDSVLFVLSDHNNEVR